MKLLKREVHAHEDVSVQCDKRLLYCVLVIFRATLATTDRTYLRTYYLVEIMRLLMITGDGKNPLQHIHLEPLSQSVE